MKKSIFSLLCACMLILLVACGQSQSDSSPETQSEEQVVVPEKTFTLDELAQYNGKDDMPAYVAFDGIVYDMSSVPAWAGGIHKGFQAGKDYSDEIAKQSPHGKSVLKKLTPVGILEK